MTETPSPAYMFMLFYIDQDSGWKQSLESFDIRGRYKNPRKAVVDLHSGIRPSRYYELQAKKTAVQLGITDSAATVRCWKRPWPR